MSSYITPHRVRIGDLRDVLPSSLGDASYTLHTDKKQALLKLHKADVTSFRILRAISGLPHYQLRRESPEDTMPAIFRISLRK